MAKCVSLALAFTLGLAVTGAASAITENPPAPLKVLRHLSFAFTYDSHSRVETKTSGFDRGDMSQGGVSGPMMGGGTQGGAFGSGGMGTEVSGSATSSGPTTVKNGTIDVDVMAATGDGGLVVDVSENEMKRTPVVRVGITDKSLFFKSDAVITDEERIVLHYLARDLVKADDLAVGTSWVDDQTEGAGIADRVHYRVTSVDSDAKTMSVDISGTNTGSGLHSYVGLTTGSMTYDVGTAVPLRISLSTHATMDGSGSHTTIETYLTSTLRSDSFHKTS